MNINQLINNIIQFNDADNAETRYSAAERIDNMMQTLRHRPLDRNPNFSENTPTGFKDRIQHFVSLFRAELSPVVRDIFNSTLRVPFDAIDLAIRNLLNTYLDKNKEYVLYSYLEMETSVSMFNLYYLKFLLDIGVRVRYIVVKGLRETNNLINYDSDDEVEVDREIIVIDDISYSGTQLADGIATSFCALNEDMLGKHTNVFLYGLTGAAIRRIQMDIESYREYPCTIHAEKMLYSPILYIGAVSKNRNRNTSVANNIIIRDTHSVIEYQQKKMATLQILQTAMSQNRKVFDLFADFYKPASTSSNTMIYLNYKIPDGISINSIMYGQITSDFLATDADRSQLVHLMNKHQYMPYDLYFYPIIYPHMYTDLVNKEPTVGFSTYKERVEHFSRPWYRFG